MTIQTKSIMRRRVSLGLPEQFRTVIMLREVEGMNISEIASVLDLTEQNIKVRLHRGRALARGVIAERVGTNARNAFQFMGARCDHIVRIVLAASRIQRDCSSSAVVDFT